MPRNAAQALAWARNQHDDGGREWGGLCLKFVRSCYDIDPFYPSAAAAWEGARLKHRETDGSKVPRGVPYFWTGGSQGFGHIVLSAGGGMCWSNDISSSGGISLAPILEITTRWRQTARGWTEDLNNARIWDRPEPGIVDVADLMRAFQHDPTRPGDEGTQGARRHVRRLERALSHKGYLDARFIDASYGTMTVAAMRRFQHDHGLEADGAPTLESVKAVGLGRFRVSE